MWNIFKDNNDWNEKSIIGFIAFLVMCLFAFADLITGYVGKDLVINEFVYDKYGVKGQLIHLFHLLI